MKKIIMNDIRDDINIILDLKENEKYKIDNKDLYIIKYNYDLGYRFVILSYTTIVAIINIDIDNNDNIKNIKYTYSTYKYSRTTTKHINYVKKIVNVLALYNCCNVDYNTFYRNIDNID